MPGIDKRSGAGAAATAPEAWSYVGTGGAVAFQNSWINRGGSANANTGTNPAKFRKKADTDTVEIHGSISGGTTTAGTTLFTLPVGYRPTTALSFPIIADSGMAQIAVGTDGTVKGFSVTGETAYGNGGLYLDPIAFSVS